MTSNLGAKQLQTNSTLGFRVQGDDRRGACRGSYDLMKEKVTTELKKNFRPEFLNRIDATVVFRSLTVEEIAEIVDLMLERVRDQLRAQQMTLEVTAGGQGSPDQARLRPHLRRAPAAPDHPEPDRGPARRAPAAGRYEPGTTIVVDKDPEAGLDIQPPSSRERPSSRDPSRRVARPTSRFVCQALRRSLPALGRPVPHLRRVEQPGRDLVRDHARAGSWPARRSGVGRAPVALSRHRRAGRPAPADRHRRARSRARRRPRPGLARAGRRRAGDRQVDAPAPGRGRAVGPAPASSTRRARNRPAQVRLRAARLGLLDGAAGDAIAVLAEHEVGRIVDVARASGPRCSSSTRSRPRPSRSSTARPAASARSASPPCA